MADRRMLTKKVTDDDNFMSLSSSAQALYLHLSMSADDDGFSNQVSVSMFKAHASVQDLEALLEKRYVYQFEDGVIVIKHWRMANALRNDRYKPTAFQEDLARLELKENGAYTMREDGCQMVAKRLSDGCQTVAKRLPQHNITKNNITKNNITKESKAAKAASARPKKTKYGEYENVLLSDDEYGKLYEELGEDLLKKCITKLDSYIASKGTKYKSHYATIKNWVIDAVREQEQKGTRSKSKVADELEESYQMLKEWGES